MPNPKIRLIRADNPSPLTGPGTNTYVLGEGELTLIDPGPDLDSHLRAILHQTKGERIRQILVTHAHLDHSDLTRKLVAATGAEVLAFGLADSGRSTVMQGLAGDGLTSSEGADLAFVPDRCMTDNTLLDLGDLQIEALHLPGHMGCHMGFSLGDILFSGDHVMAWSTTLVSPPDGDMADYMTSLDRLSRRTWSRMLPGHGAEVGQPAARLGELTHLRLARRASILNALRALGPADTTTLTRCVYTDTPAHLLPAAARNVLSHLIQLMGEGLATPAPGPLASATFHAI